MNPRRFRLALLTSSVAALLGACSSTSVVRAVQHERMAPFASIELPPLAEGSLRLFVYRPQALVGQWGAAIVIVNDQWMGNRADPVRENHLLPGAVFVVDVPAGPLRIGWYAPDRGRVADERIELAGIAGTQHHLRWTLLPTRGELQSVDAAQARRDIEALRFSAYVNLATAARSP